MKIRIKKCSAIIAGALFFLFCVQLAEESLAEQFTLYIESDNVSDKYNIRNANDLHKSYEATLIDELARIGFKVKSSLNKDDVTEHDIILKAGFIRLGEKLLIPTAEIKTAKTKTILASLKTTSFSLDGEIFQVEKQLDSSAISIARMLYARLLSMNWAELNFEKNTWETENSTPGRAFSTSIFGRLVLGSIKANSSDHIVVGKRMTRSANFHILLAA